MQEKPKWASDRGFWVLLTVAMYESPVHAKLRILSSKYFKYEPSYEKLHFLEFGIKILAFQHVRVLIYDPISLIQRLHPTPVNTRDTSDM